MQENRYISIEFIQNIQENSGKIQELYGNNIYTLGLLTLTLLSPSFKELLERSR